MFQRFEDLEIIQRLDETHGGSTQIFLGKYEKKLVVCKVLPNQYRLSKKDQCKIIKVLSILWMKRKHLSFSHRHKQTE